MAQDHAWIKDPQAAQASAFRAASELTTAVKSGDMMVMLEKMYPQVRKTMSMKLKGGDAELQSVFRKRGDALKQAGAEFESYRVFQPTGIYPVKNFTETIVLLPYSYVLKVKAPNGQLMRSKKTSFLYAISKVAEPDTWYFLDGSAYSINDMRFIFYDLPVNIPLPIIKDEQLR